MTPRCRTWPRQVLIALVRGYRYALSPWLGSNCRFTPSCSAYAMQALELHGAAAGACLTAARLLRCHPFCAGGHDPVPGARTPVTAPIDSSDPTRHLASGPDTTTYPEKTVP